MSISEITRLHRWETKTKKGEGCWEWTGTHTKSGYGMFMWEPGVRITAHRAAYRLFVGPIPANFEVDHLCRNRICVNPSHLEAVSVAENRSRRRHARGKDLPNGRKTHCAHGHPFEGANLRILKDGSRACRRCGREAMRRYRSK